MSPLSAPPVRHAPNVTPMIDVMLVLLIIFMLVLPAMDGAAEARPPGALSAAPRPDEEGDVVLAIDRAGRVFLDGRLVPRGELPRALVARFARRTLDRRLYVKADRELPYAAILDALDAARRGGVAVAGMVTEQPTEPRR